MHANQNRIVQLRDERSLVKVVTQRMDRHVMARLLTGIRRPDTAASLRISRSGRRTRWCLICSTVLYAHSVSNQKWRYYAPMCGRLDQNDTARNYVSAFGWADAIFDSEAEPSYNSAPGTYRPVLHVQNGERRVDDVFWSYRPAWAANATPTPGKKRIPIAVNAKVEKLTGAYWKPLLRGGRGIVCASGWYEWTGPKGPKGAKQPWHIHRKDREPLYLLALACFGPFKERREEAGFVLVTADALGGMVDIHDRRPVAVSADDAHRWLDPALTADEAARLARTAMLDAGLFEWTPVSQEVNRAGTDGHRLVEPIALTDTRQ